MSTNWQRGLGSATWFSGVTTCECPAAGWVGADGSGLPQWRLLLSSCGLHPSPTASLAFTHDDRRVLKDRYMQGLLRSKLGNGTVALLPHFLHEAYLRGTAGSAPDHNKTSIAIQIVIIFLPEEDLAFNLLKKNKTRHL